MIFSRLIRRVGEKRFHVQAQAAQGIKLVQLALFTGGVILISSIVIIWISIFLYTAFYYAYMPNMMHTRPVHFNFKDAMPDASWTSILLKSLFLHELLIDAKQLKDFATKYFIYSDRSCSDQKGMCSHPSAHVELTKKQQLLMVGQPYKINFYLEMPESTTNQQLGMFMVCAKLQSRDDYVVARTCRPTMLHYRSTLLHYLTTFVFSPMLVFGNSEEKQNLAIELFGNFEEDQVHPVTSITISIESRYVEFYSASIGIHAHLSGLRYLMFHWPTVTAIIGGSTNLFFITLICVLSYLRFTPENEPKDEQFAYEKSADEEMTNKNQTEISSASSSIEGASLLEDALKLHDEPGELEINPIQTVRSRFIENIEPRSRT